MDAAYNLSSFIVDTTFVGLPQDAINVAKKEVLDTLATTLGGSQDRAVRELYKLVKTWGGRGESTIMAHGGRFPAPNAVLVNSAMASALAYHDTHERGHLHAASVVVPSAFAVSELKGGVDGKKFITAICVAVELGCRLGIATKPARTTFMDGWSYGPLLGYFTAAAAAGKILALDKQKMHHALGIAYNQASGNGQAVVEDADAEKIGYGFAAQGGITSALLAKRGVTAAKDIFESEMGFYNLYHAGCDREALLKDLGQKFQMFDMSFKPYTNCRLCHRYVDAIIKLAKDNKIKADEVEEITPFICKIDEGLCLPEPEKKAPKSVAAAHMSLPWALACGLVRNKADLSEYSEESLKDSALLNTAAKVNPVLDPSLPDELAFTKVRVRTKRGTLETKTDYARGSFQNPMTFEDIEHKLRDCAATLSGHIPEKNLAQAASMVRNIEAVQDVGEIVRLVTQQR